MPGARVQRERMQCHLNGVRPGDPELTEAASTGEASVQFEVLIIGRGSAGLTLAAQLSAFPEISVKIIDRKPGPLNYGQADGIACRSMEMLQSFGFADKVAREAYWVNEVTFWRPVGGGGKIQRVERVQDVEDDLSEMPHVILSQARVHGFLLDSMIKSPRRLEPDYSRELVDLTRDRRGGGPMEATESCLDEAYRTETIFARYVVGCDGARSAVRKFLGLELKGEAARQLRGVMDVLSVTDFPDIRLKCAIQSADQGSLLIIPREGGAGNECCDGRCLQSGLETRRRDQGAGQAGTSAYLFGRAPSQSQGTDRFQSRHGSPVLGKAQVSGRSGSVSAILQEARAKYGRGRDSLRPVFHHDGQQLSVPCDRANRRNALSFGSGNQGG